MMQAISASDILTDIQNLYDRGLPPGDSTGWEAVDAHYTVSPCQWTLVTGIPGHGKSEWLDALTTNLAMGGWKFVVFSPENQPHEMHMSKLISKFVRKPFGEGPSDRVNAEELQIATGILDMSYRFLRCDPDFVRTPNVQSVIDAASGCFQQWIDQGDEKLGMIIDPWNELDHGRPNNLTETEYISQQLSYIRQFARDWRIHVWIMAHPKKMHKLDTGLYAVPSPYDVSGSSHWYNKADNCITVYRNVMDRSAPVQIHIQKVRFKNNGSPGLAELHYDRIAGVYSDQPFTDTVAF